VPNYHTMKASQEGVEVKLHTFLTSILDIGVGLTSSPWGKGSTAKEGEYAPEPYWCGSRKKDKPCPGRIYQLSGL